MTASHTQLDLLCFAPHPDDAEILCGGILALMATKGHKVGLVDLTRGEMGTQGDSEIRKQEAEAASKVLGLTVRENLGLPDCGVEALSSPRATDSQIQKVIQTIRRFRPHIILAPYWIDRHPDHGATSDLVTRAVYFASLKRLDIKGAGEPHVPKQVLYYALRTAFEPSFLVDVSSVYDKKVAAAECYKSQLQRSTLADSGKTLVSSPLSLASIRARDEYYGAMLGVRHAEGFLVKTALPLNDPIVFFQQHPANEALFFLK